MNKEFLELYFCLVNYFTIKTHILWQTMQVKQSQLY